jgi:hypothetical protein
MAGVAARQKEGRGEGQPGCFLFLVFTRSWMDRTIVVPNTNLSCSLSVFDLYGKTIAMGLCTSVRTARYQANTPECRAVLDAHK